MKLIKNVLALVLFIFVSVFSNAQKGILVPEMTQCDSHGIGFYDYL